MYNAVVFYNWIGGINGALIDAFEYYIAILEHTDIKFILINRDDRDKFIEIFENRYDINDLNWKENIVVVDKPARFIRVKYDKVLVVDYSTIFMTKGLLRANKMIVISDLHTDKKEYMYDKKLQNVIYYGEMPFVYKDHQYRMKLLFDRFRSLNGVDSGIYINSPFNKNRDFIKDLELPDKPIIYKSESHLDNMFEKFDTYLYYHANKWFDPHPRLFLECYYYNKEIIYINNYGIKDGGWYRYNDLMNRGLEDRYLNKDDEVVREFI